MQAETGIKKIRYITNAHENYGCNSIQHLSIETWDVSSLAMTSYRLPKTLEFTVAADLLSLLVRKSHPQLLVRRVHLPGVVIGCKVH